jgi:O-glycosyl hydrolase
VRFLTLTVAALGAGLVISGAWATVAERDASADVTAVTVDLGATRQSIDGFGTSNRVWSDPHLANASNASVPPEAQRQILTALYRRLGLTRVRNVLDNGIQPSAGAPMSFAGKRADDHIAFVKQAKGYGLTTFFPGPVYLEDWMKADDPGAYVNWAMTMLQRWRARGLEPALYAPLNEPERARNFPPQWMHDVVVQLGSRLRAAGFKTKLVVPDDENPVDAYRRAVAVLQDPEARRYVGAIAFHIYRRNSDEDWQRLRRLATQYRLPLWMTEYNSKTYKDWRSSLDWAVKTHDLLTVGGVNAIDYIWGYFGDWVGNNTLLRLDFDGNVYRGFEPTALYYMTGQYSRYVRPGDVRIGSTSGRPALISAYKGRGRVVVVATNPSSRGEAVRVNVVGGKLSGPAAVVRSSSTERWRTLPSVSTAGGSFVATLPPESITTFVIRRAR